VSVRDNGAGLPAGTVGDGLGTQIVRTLVHGELGGSIVWDAAKDEGTEVTITVPLQFLHEKVVTATVPSV
jgi:two-component sensor histidine kinase